MAGVDVFSIEGTIEVRHYPEQRAVHALWISMTSGKLRDALRRGMSECQRLGALSWLVDLTQGPGVPTQADLNWIVTSGAELAREAGLKAVINIHGKSAIASMGARRWSEAAEEGVGGSRDCYSLSEALEIAAEVASKAELD